MKILSRGFKTCEGFGGWGVNGATNSGVVIMGGRTCHPCCMNSGRSIWFICEAFFFVVASKRNLLLQYLNSKSRAFRLRFGENGGFGCWYCSEDA